MAKNINETEFDKGTQLKLSIFRECFREWLPVFIHNKYVEKKFIYDFFAGSGKDPLGSAGSPLILLDEGKGENMIFCSNVSKGEVTFAFNEKENEKVIELESCVKEHIKTCLNSCGRLECVYNTHIKNADFKSVINSQKVNDILANPKYGKFVLLDQYGFKEVDNDIFKKLVKSPKTDFIFFISSSFIRRFKDHPATLRYFETNRIDFDESKPKECHQYVADYFRTLIPDDIEFYLHHFTIKKGANYHGLIFGTGHTLGMEKFLKVCWEKNALSGDANFNKNDDFEIGTLFYSEEKTNKIESFNNLLEKKILLGQITNNVDGLKFALKNGMKGKVYLDKIKELIHEKKLVTIDGSFNQKTTNIHRIKNADVYQIIPK